MSTIKFKIVVHAHDANTGLDEQAMMESVPDGSANIGGDNGDVSAFHLLAHTLDHARAFLERVAPTCPKCKHKATACHCCNVTRN